MLYTMMRKGKMYQTDDGEIVDEIGHLFTEVEVSDGDQECDAIWLEYDSFGNICEY